MQPQISIIIPNWNGKAFLVRCVGAAFQSAILSGLPFECLVVDDASTDSSIVDIKSRFPEVKTICHTRNQGFAAAVNEGAKQALGEILVLINNDLIANPDFIEQICKHFKYVSSLFGVTAKTISWDTGKANHVNMKGTWDSCFINLEWSNDPMTSRTMFLQGGACAVRRDLFLQLGGFSRLYHPGYWEDYDLSYQALKAGYQNIYEPAAIGKHLGQGSMIRAYGEDFINYVKERNRLLFMAVNLNEEYYDRFWQEMPSYLARHQVEVRLKHRMKALIHLWRIRSQIKTERLRRAQSNMIPDSVLISDYAQ